MKRRSFLQAAAAVVALAGIEATHAQAEAAPATKNTSATIPGTATTSGAGATGMWPVTITGTSAVPAVYPTSENLFRRDETGSWKRTIRRHETGDGVVLRTVLDTGWVPC